MLLENVKVRVRIGHSFAIHLFLISKIPPPIREKCQVNLSIQNSIQDFTKYRDIRINLYILLNVVEEPST